MTPRTTIAAAALAIALTAGCVPQGPDLAPWLGVDPDPVVAAEQTDVVVIGDSLTDSAKKAALADFAARPDLAVSYQAFGATRWQHWYGRFANVPPGAVVEVLLGTNNLTLEDIDTAKANIVAGLNILRDRAPRCIVWFRLNTTSASYRPDVADETAQLNAWMDTATAAGYYPLVEAPWDAVSAGHDDWLLLPEDPVHMNTDGQQAYADEMIDGADLCTNPPA